MSQQYDDPTGGLSNQVFGTSNRFSEGQMTSRAEGIVRKLTIYTWPKGTSDDDMLSVLSFLMAYGQSEDDRPSAWATWVFTFCNLCFPEFQDAITKTSREYTFAPLPAAFIAKILELCEMAENVDGSDAGSDYALAAKNVPKVPKFPDMNHSAETLAPNFAAGQLIPVVYGYAALLMFLAGKKINEKNMVTISEKRPQNLIDAYSINEEAQYALTGEGKMSTSAYAGINQAWVTHAGARIAIISEVASFGSGSTLAQRVVHTITKMSENSGMNPAYYIHRFLLAFPEAQTFSCVRPSLQAYVTSIREVAAAPSHIQPYYKLIYGDGTRAFHRNSLKLLAACGIAYEKQTSPSMKNFELGEGANAAIAMYDAEAISRNLPTIGSLTFAAEKKTTAD